MTDRKRARFESVNNELTDLGPEELDEWLAKNVRSVHDVRSLLRTLILAIGALKR